MRALTGVLALGLAAASAAPLLAQCPDGSPPPCARAATGARPPAPTSIAILPFVNRSADTSDAFLAEALPEQIQGRLARVRELQPKSQTAVTAQWRRTPDPMEAARVLRTAWFVTGTVRRSGRSLTVAAELVRAASGDGAWSATFRRADDDIAAIEEQIAESVAVAIVGRLAPAQVSELRRTPTRDPEAYRLYLYATSRVRRRTEDDTRAALAALAEAVRRDPGFAAAWGRTGLARVQQASYGFELGRSRDSLYALGDTAVARALRLDPDNVDALLASGYRDTRRGEYDRAYATLQRARSLDSLNSEAAHYLGVLHGPLIGVSLPQPAAAWFRRALALDPGDRNAWRNLGVIALGDGQLAVAERLLDTALAFGPWAPALYYRAEARFALGNGVGAMADIADATRLDSAMYATWLAAMRFEDPRAIYAVVLGDSAPARAALARLRADPTPAALADIARYAAALGLGADALDALERLRAAADPDEPRCAPAVACSASLRTWRLLHEPAFLPLRRDPRFAQLWDATRPRAPWLEGQAP